MKIIYLHYFLWKGEANEQKGSLEVPLARSLSQRSKDTKKVKGRDCKGEEVMVLPAFHSPYKHSSLRKIIVVIKKYLPNKRNATLRK